MQINQNVNITSKQPDLRTSIFTIMSKMAVEEKAINLSQGFPDYNCHPKLIELLHKHMQAGHNQYAPMPGVPLFCETICQKVEDEYGTVYHPQKEVTVTAGATEALYCAITSSIHAGDEVILFEPWYDAYIPVIEYNKGVPISIPLELPDYHINWEKVKQAISGKTKAIVINSPHNPAGAVLSEQDMLQLNDIVRETGIIIIADEVYEHIVYDGHTHQSIAAHPQLAERAFVISSMGKTFHATGWKVGYCLAPEAMMHEFRKIHQFVTFSVNTPAQYAYAEFLQDKNNYRELAGFYQAKRDLFRDMLNASRFELLPCSGTYFQLASYKKISDETDMQFVERLTREYKIAAIPTSVFYTNRDDNKIIRFCFAKKDQTLTKAAEVLCTI